MPKKSLQAISGAGPQSTAQSSTASSPTVLWQWLIVVWSAFTRTFYMVYGERGVGKTSLIMRAAREAVGGGGRAGGGILYVEVPSDVKTFGRSEVGKTIAKSFGYYFWSFSWLRGVGKSLLFREVKWDELLDAKETLERHAARYRATYGKKVTLIIDGFEQLVTTPEARVAYDDLLGWARLNANKGNVTVVFVASEGQGAQLAFRDGAESRMDAIEVGDESDEVAAVFLKELLLDGTISEQEQQRREQMIPRLVAEVTGGRLVDLVKAAAKVKRGSSFEVIRNYAMVHARGQHTDAQAVHTQAPEFIEAVSQELIDNGDEIPCASLRPIAAKVLGVTEHKGSKHVDELVGAVLRANVFALHSASDTVTFQSRAMRTYLVTTLGLTARPASHA